MTEERIKESIKEGEVLKEKYKGQPGIIATIEEHLIYLRNLLISKLEEKQGEDGQNSPAC